VASRKEPRLQQGTLLQRAMESSALQGYKKYSDGRHTVLGVPLAELFSGKK
jgi:hypothetical protein